MAQYSPVLPCTALYGPVLPCTDMAQRSAGGRAASGRYKKHDTARKIFIETVGMPSLRMGKRIAAADWRRLFLPRVDS